MQNDVNTSSSLTHNKLTQQRFISLSGDPCKMTQTQAVHWLTTHCDTTKIHITIRRPMQNDVNTSSSLTHNTLWHNKDSYQVTHARWRKHKQFTDSQHTVTQQRFISGDPCKMTRTQAVHWHTTHCDTTKMQWDDQCKMMQTQAVHWLTTHCDTTKIHITIRWPMQDDANISSSLTHNTLWHNKDSYHYQVTNARWRKHKQFTDRQWFNEVSRIVTSSLRNAKRHLTLTVSVFEVACVAAASGLSLPSTLFLTCFGIDRRSMVSRFTLDDAAEVLVSLSPPSLPSLLPSLVAWVGVAGRDFRDILCCFDFSCRSG